MNDDDDDDDVQQGRCGMNFLVTFPLLIALLCLQGIQGVECPEER